MIQSVDDIVKGVLEGNKSILARAITWVESRKAEHKMLADRILEGILSHRADSVRIGITGVPGVGKSTFIEQIGLALIDQGHKVAVLAIDPSSSRTGGSILGDKTRMEQLSIHPRSFIRPTPAGNHLGGLSASTQDVILLCEAAGYDRIIVETVGVGQSETEVYHVTDFFLLLMLAGAGDELQGIKRGIIEMCDSMVIHKADGNNIAKARAARSQYAKALHFLPPTESGWTPKVLLASSLEKTGIQEVLGVIEDYIALLREKELFYPKRIRQAVRSFEEGYKQQLGTLILQLPAFRSAIDAYKMKISNQEISSFSAIKKVMENLQIIWRE